MVLTLGCDTYSLICDLYFFKLTTDGYNELNILLCVVTV